MDSHRADIFHIRLFEIYSVDCLLRKIPKQKYNYLELLKKTGSKCTQYELSKLFKPVTDMKKDFKEGLVSELKPIREGMKNLPKAITFP